MICARIAFSYNMAEIATMKALCEAEGVKVFDLNISGQVSFAGGDTGFYLDVPQDSAQHARDILEESEYAKFVIT